VATNDLTPSKAAYRLTHVLNAVASAHGTPRFPIDVRSLAMEAANIFHWPDPIIEIKAAPIPKFEGALFADANKQKWLLLYNDRLRSPGRIRFTQAHELGHYLLHRTLRSSFECTESDMVDLTTDDLTHEAQADSFASTLLMPLDDFRAQMQGSADFEGLAACAERYGVSLTAATLSWLKYTDTCAVLVVHRDGFIDWAYSSRSAFDGGAFFKTRGRTNAIPEASLASDETVSSERCGIEITATTWFPHAASDLSLREMKVCADQFDYIMTLLVLPKHSRVWKPRI
jgi:hypothetical protein